MDFDELNKIMAKTTKIKMEIDKFAIAIFSFLKYYHKLENVKMEFNDNLFSIGSYDIISKSVELNLSCIQKSAENEFKNENENKDLMLKLLIISTLAHEMCHARQYSLVSSSKKSFEAELIKLLSKEDVILCNSYLRYYLQDIGVYNDIMQKRRYYYYNSYDINPLERMANQTASDVCLGIVDKLQNKEIYDNFSKKERLLRLKGYIKFNEVISPVYSYAHVLGIEKELKDFCDANDILQKPLNFRMGYGLPITVEEYEEQKRLLK